jgi:diaminopimelate epimerase
MKLRFTKMQGAGNDFVVLDATAAPIELSPAQARALGDRRFGVGADQILVVEPSSTPGIDFGYRIYNHSGDEVEHCGNGARCFLKFVRARGLTRRDSVRVQTMNRVLELRLQADGRVTVDMGAPVFEPAQVPFETRGLQPRREGAGDWWPLALPGHGTVEVAVASMGNPHAVQRVASADDAAVAVVGPLVEAHPRFAQQVNAGFVEVLSPAHVKLRVFERGAGETLACGTGACAAVACGIRMGWLGARVDVDTRGGRLTIEWAGRTDAGAAVFMTGPAETVFEGEIEL